MIESNMMNSEDISNQGNNGMNNTNANNGNNGTHSNGARLTNANEAGTSTYNENNNALNGNWDVPRPKKRGRKPGSTAAARLSVREAGVANNHKSLTQNEPEIRRRKRETEVVIGDQIRRLRLESGLSQEELGRSSRMSTSYISRLETNEVNPTVDALSRIVRVFGLTIDGLLGLDTKAANILDSEELDPEIRVWLFKLKGKKVSARAKRIIQVVIDEELKELNHQAS